MKRKVSTSPWILKALAVAGLMNVAMSGCEQRIISAGIEIAERGGDVHECERLADQYANGVPAGQRTVRRARFVELCQQGYDSERARQNRRIESYECEQVGGPGGTRCY